MYEIKYISKWTGKSATKINTNNRSDAAGWAKSLASDNDCKAECYEVDDNGNRKHIVSYGDN